MSETGKVTIVNLETGERLERFTVDAREIVAGGGFVLEADYVEPAAEPEAPAKPRRGAAAAPVVAPAAPDGDADKGQG